MAAGNESQDMAKMFAESEAKLSDMMSIVDNDAGVAARRCPFDAPTDETQPGDDADGMEEDDEDEGGERRPAKWQKCVVCKHTSDEKHPLDDKLKWPFEESQSDEQICDLCTMIHKKFEPAMSETEFMEW